MKQLFVDSDGRLVVREQPIPKVSPTGVLVRTEYSAISTGTESDFIRQRREHPGTLEEMPLGYSLAGTVVAAGPDATSVHVGDKVACAGMGVSNHAEYVSVPRNLFAKLPDGVSSREACEVALASCCLHGVRQGAVCLGHTVVVQGTGVLGQLSHQFARLSGARTVVVGNQNEMRLSVARELGAGLVVNASAQDPVAAVMEYTCGLGADVVLYCAASTSPKPIEQAMEMCIDRGTVVIVGAAGMYFPRPQFFKKELQIRIGRSYGPGRYDPSYERDGIDYPIGYVRWTENRNMGEFVQLLAEECVRVDPMITHEIPFRSALDAYDLVLDHHEETLAVVMKYT
jgi:2-desacetyl-2-hydroxyethyl bacteriochlorophyllide A dehydrogenase